MAAGKHTRFPFLATVRSLMATVVTVLVVSVVVMVIVVVHRPIEVVFHSDGYILADDWWINVTDDSESYNTPVRSDSLVSYAHRPAGSVAQSPANGPAAAPPLYSPAEEMEILLGITAVNPSGRSRITGSIDKIRIVDILNKKEICFFEPTKNASVNFDLPPHVRHRDRRWVTIRDTRTLQYLYDNHLHDARGFSVLLVLETTYGPKEGSMKNLTYYCSPVTFVNIGLDTEELDVDATCKTARDMGYTPNFESITITYCDVSM